MPSSLPSWFACDFGGVKEKLCGQEIALLIYGLGLLTRGSEKWRSWYSGGGEVNSHELNGIFITFLVHLQLWLCGGGNVWTGNCITYVGIGLVDSAK